MPAVVAVDDSLSAADAGYMPVLTVAPAVGVQGRALGSAGTSSSTTTSDSSSSSTTNPFFTGPTSTTNADDVEGGLTKTALEWVFAIAALLTITSFTLWRYSRMRRRLASRRRTSSSHLIDRRDSRLVLPRTTGLPRVSTTNATGAGAGAGGMDLAAFYPSSLTSGRYPFLAEPLPAHIQEHLAGTTPGAGRGPGGRGRRAARGADIDGSGRRGGRRGGEDDEDGDNKDELPAYDAVGSPPQYIGADTVVVDGIPLRLVDVHGLHAADERHQERSHDGGGREHGAEDGSSPPYERSSGRAAATGDVGDVVPVNFLPC